MEQDLRVRVLGGAELAVSGRPLVELASAKAAALVVYLAVTGTGTRARRSPGCSGAICRRRPPGPTCGWC